MLRLHELSLLKGREQKRKRKGRVKARSGQDRGARAERPEITPGYKMRRGFEGGQMPLFQRLPKRGFTNFSRQWVIVNLEALKPL